MINFIESSAGRIAARVQRIGAHFDPDILSLPGGSIMAVVLWAYANTVLNLRRSKAPKRVDMAKPCICTR
jgi:hypothetical protein